MTDETVSEDWPGPAGPSYHDLHITTAEIERTSIFNLPYGYEVRCTRVTGWFLYDNGARMSPHLREPEPSVLGGEYEGPDKWLVLDVDGHVIVDSRPGPGRSE